jgi:uncharacterized protein (TIGR00369 family)
MLIDDNYCFACGSKNSDGLKLKFTYSDDNSKAETTYIPPEKFQGWKGIVHGGIITTLLDEVMAKAAIIKGYHILTGEITVRFKNPAKTLEPLRCEAEIEEVKKKLLYVKGTAYNKDDEVVAEARSKMIIT